MFLTMKSRKQKQDCRLLSFFLVFKFGKEQKKYVVIYVVTESRRKELSHLPQTLMLQRDIGARNFEFVAKTQNMRRKNDATSPLFFLLIKLFQQVYFSWYYFQEPKGGVHDMTRSLASFHLTGDIFRFILIFIIIFI